MLETGSLEYFAPGPSQLFLSLRLVLQWSLLGCHSRLLHLVVLIIVYAAAGGGGAAAAAVVGTGAAVVVVVVVVFLHWYCCEYIACLES